MNDTLAKLRQAAETNDEKLWQELREYAAADSDQYWKDVSEVLAWKKPWTKLWEPTEGARRWFVGGDVSYFETLFGEDKDQEQELLVVYEADGSRHAYTRRGLREAVERVGAYLLDQGVSSDSRVIFCIENKHIAAIYSLACLCIGAKFGFVYFRLPNPVITQLLSTVEATAFLYEHGPRGNTEAPDLSSLKHIQTVIEIDGISQSYPVSVSALAVSDPYPSRSFTPRAFSADSPSFYIYSSGTTSKPKATLAGTAGSFLANISGYYEIMHGGGTNYFMLDFAWAATNICFFAPLMAGETVVLSRQHFRIGDPHGYELIDKENVTSTLIPIQYFEREMANIKPYPIRNVSVGGARLSSKAVENCRNVFLNENLSVRHGYGSAEVGSLAMLSISPTGQAINDWDHELLHPALGVTTDITHSADKPILLIKNNLPSMTPGIVGDEGSYKTLWCEKATWFITGDVAEKQKYQVRLRGRADDLLKVKGRWLDSFLLQTTVSESIARTSCMVDQIQIKGVQHLTLFIEGPEAPELIEKAEACIRETFGAYALPAEIKFIEELPRTAAGKIRTGDLAQHG